MIIDRISMESAEEDEEVLSQSEEEEEDEEEEDEEDVDEDEEENIELTDQQVGSETCLFSTRAAVWVCLWWTHWRQETHEIQSAVSDHGIKGCCISVVK